jgi:hypothetical protein
LAGLGGLAATWGTARLIAGPRAGAFATLSLAVCGVWYVTMFNLTKDVPFAAAMICATYFVLRTTRGLPKPRARDLAAFGILLGAACGQRALGLLVVAYVPIAIALAMPQRAAPAMALRFCGRALLLFLPAFALGYVIMIAAWPWAALSPLNPIRGLLAFSHFDYPIRTLLFGQTYLMGEVPRIYEPVYLAIKLPLILLLGAALALGASSLEFAQGDAQARRRARESALIAATAILPVLLHIAGHGPAFSGMRHFIFVVPPLAVMAGIGLDRAIRALETNHRAFAAVALTSIAASFVWNASVLVRLHPYEYLYFNRIVGGLAGANQRFDTDYWVNVMHEAVVDLDTALAREKPSPGPYRVAVCSDGVQFTHDMAHDKRLQLATGSEAADFFIAPTHMHCDSALDGKVIARIERMGTVIGVVKDLRGSTRSTVAGGH